MGIKDKSSEIKFTEENIQNALIEIQDATQHQDYNKVKEIMKNYSLSASIKVTDSLKKLAKILDTEISKEILLQMKADQDFERFKEIFLASSYFLYGQHFNSSIEENILSKLI